MKLLIVYAAFIIQIVAQFTLKNIGTKLSSYNTLVTGVTYELNFTINKLIPAGSTLMLTFKQEYRIPSSTLANCKGSRSSSVVPTDVTCSSVYSAGLDVYSILFADFYSTGGTQTFLWLKFDIKNPWGQASCRIDAYIKDSGSTTLQTETFFINYIASNLTSCSYKGVTQKTGESVSHIIKFTPIRDLITSSYIAISMPYWFTGTTSMNSSGSTSLSCLGIQNTDSASLPCSLSTLDSTKQIITINNFVSSNKTSPGQIQIKLDTLRNPWSLAPFGQIKFQVYYANPNHVVSQRCTGMYQTVTQPNSFGLMNFNLTQFSISSVNNAVRLILAIQNPLTKNKTRIRIQYSSEISVSFSGSGVIVFSQNSTQMILTNVMTIDRTSGSLNLMGFSITTPPSTRSFTFKCTAQYLESVSNVYDIDTISRTFQNNPGTITSTGIVLGNTTINVVTAYQIQFKVMNKIISGGFINIIFPSDLQIDASATCSDNVTNSSTCVISTRNITITINGSISGLTSFLVSINKIKNGAQSAQTPSFMIYSYNDNQFDSLIDSLVSGLTVTMAASQIFVASVTPSNLTTYSMTSYKFDITLNDDIAQNGYIQIQFPPSLIPVSASLSLDSATFSTATCSLSLSSQILKILNCFMTNPMNTRVTSLTLGGILNPPSFKASDTFKIRTYSALPTLTNYIQSGLTVQMNKAYVISTFSITPSVLTVHTLSIYTFDIVHSIPLALNDYLILNLESSMDISNTPSCTGVTGLTTVSCIRVSNSQLKITYASAPSSQTLQYKVSNIMNYDIADTALTFDVTVYTSDNFIKEKATTTVIFSQATISSVSVNNDDKIILLGHSQITLGLNSPFTLSSSFDTSKTKLQISLPSGLTAQLNSTCVVSTGTCSRLSSSKFQIVSVGLGMSTYSIVMTNILLPLINLQSGSFSLVYTYDSKNVSVAQSGIFVRPFCMSPCKACNVLATKCKNCLPAPNTLIYYNQVTFMCQVSCPDNGTYPDGSNVCQNCVSPCSKCSDVQNCTSCVANSWLYQKRCINSCPDNFYNSSAVCQACVDPCIKCKSQTQCLTCKSGFYYNFLCLAQSSCPTGTFGNSLTLKCQACKSPCLACQKQENNCTSCVPTFFLYNNLCVNICPDGMFSTGSNCLSCTGLCGNCLNTSYCLTCKADYYHNGSCVSSTSCPAGTFADNIQMKCNNCPSVCTSCQSSANCTSCDTNFYILYQYACLTTCPNNTFKNGFTCQVCMPSCANCENTSTTCLSCPANSYLYNSTCQSSCPRDFYQNNGKCTQCRSQCSDCTNGTSCTQCSGSLFLTSTGQCLSSCPFGYYGSLSNKTCQACQSPCSDCDMSSLNCTSCISNRVFYANDCSSSTCPSQYFNVSNICKTCNNCNNCLDADTCQSCKPGYFWFAGTCYTICPSTAPIHDLVNKSCTLCDAICQSCQGTAKNCTKCNQGQYFFNSGCFQQCPSGYVENLYSRTCQQKKITSIFYFPSMASLLALLIILSYSKYIYRQTQFITVLTSFVSLFSLISWIIYLGVLYLFQFSIQRQLVNTFVVVGLAVIALSLILGISYQTYLQCVFDCDLGYSSWIKHDSFNSKMHKIVLIASLPNFIFYRFLYGRLFHRVYFTLCYSDGQKLLTITHRMALLSIIFQLLPMVGISFYAIYNKQVYDQTVYSALDTLIINIVLIILLLIDGSKSGQQFFGQLRGKLPFKIQTKGKYLEVDSNASLSIDNSSVASNADPQDYRIQKKKQIKSEVDEKERQVIFRKITCIENLNKFGHLNSIIPNQEEQSRSLPERKQLLILPEFNLHYREQDNNVMDDLFFAQEQQQNFRQQDQSIRKALQEKTKQAVLQEKEREAKRSQQLRIQMRLQEQQKIAQFNRQEQQRLQRQRLQRLLDDQLEQQNLECLDIVAIDKAENKDKPKKSPLDYLNKCKSVDDRLIDQKAAKKLQDSARKNGIDPDFMKQTFSVQKHHNPQLLNSIIDKRHHVNRGAVKEMFKQTNNKQILQQLFSKNSTLDIERLKQIMNDEEGLNMIEKLMNSEKGIVSPQIAKALLEKNSKFKPQFTKKLLSGKTGADEQKLRKLLRQTEGEKDKQDNLKALKKIGGDTLQNTQMIQNMLGQQAKLDHEQFTKVALSLSMKALQSLFGQQSPQINRVVSKILNNKKLNLRSLSPILQDQQIIYELGKTLGDNNSVVEQNLTNLLKNCIETADPDKLKRLLQNKQLVSRLLGGSIIDPEFITQIIKKGGNTSFDLLQRTLNQMSPADIKKVFEFTGQKNIDYKNLSKIFQENQNTDPQLVRKIMDPQLIDEVFTKNNNVNSTMLTKLVEKGSKFDKQNIINIYGKNTDKVFAKNHQNNIDKQGRRTNKFKDGLNNEGPSVGPQGDLHRGFSHSGFNGAKKDGVNGGLHGQNNQLGLEGSNLQNPQNNQTQYDFKFNFNKTANQNFNKSEKGDTRRQQNDNQLIMSRTDGGMMGFLNPFKIKEQKDKQKDKLQKDKLEASLDERDEFDDLGENNQDGSQEFYGNQYVTPENQAEQGQARFRKRKAPAKKKKLKKITDIRHPAQKIYLQPIIAPHQLQMSKTFRKRLKRDQSQSTKKLVMDEDNDIFDIDF